MRLGWGALRIVSALASADFGFWMNREPNLDMCRIWGNLIHISEVDHLSDSVQNNAYSENDSLWKEEFLHVHYDLVNFRHSRSMLSPVGRKMVLHLQTLVDDT